MKPQRVAAHPYQELATEIVSKIDSGDLAPGTRLPSVRALAKEHDMSAMTAQKALNLLAQDGYAEAVPGLGYYVTEPPVEDQVTGDQALEAITRQLDELQGAVTELRARVEALETRS